MSTVLCPTRGGQASIPNQDRAIDIAKERGADLIFLYVSDVHFLDHIRTPFPVDDMEKQLDEIGEFVLVMATERAGEAGVNATSEVRRGAFRHALEEVIEAYQASVVVLGSGSRGTGITTPAYQQDLAEHLVSTCGVEVIISAQGEIVQHLKPSVEG